MLPYLLKIQIPMKSDKCAYEVFAYQTMLYLACHVMAVKAVLIMMAHDRHINPKFFNAALFIYTIKILCNSMILPVIC